MAWIQVEGDGPNPGQHIGHTLDPKDPQTWVFKENECVAEVSGRCRVCREITIGHLTDDAYNIYRNNYGNKWPIGHFLYLGWETTAGICPNCWEKPGADRLN